MEGELCLQAFAMIASRWRYLVVLDCLCLVTASKSAEDSIVETVSTSLPWLVNIDTRASKVHGHSPIAHTYRITTSLKRLCSYTTTEGTTKLRRKYLRCHLRITQADARRK